MSAPIELKTTERKQPKPTPSQRRVLENILAGRNIIEGVNGSGTGTVLSLHRKGWLQHPDGSVTAAGLEALSR